MFARGATHRAPARRAGLSRRTTARGTFCRPASTPAVTTLRPRFGPRASLVTPLRRRSDEAAAIPVRLFGEPEPAQGPIQQLRPCRGVSGVGERQTALGPSPILGGPVAGLDTVHAYTLRDDRQGSTLRQFRSAASGICS